MSFHNSRHSSRMGKESRSKGGWVCIIHFHSKQSCTTHKLLAFPPLFNSSEYPTDQFMATLYSKLGQYKYLTTWKNGTDLVKSWIIVQHYLYVAHQQMAYSNTEHHTQHGYLPHPTVNTATPHTRQTSFTSQVASRCVGYLSWRVLAESH